MAVDWRRRLRVSRFDPANPQASFLKPFERIVLSGSDESTTRAAYGIPASVRIFGPWVGNLGNDGERITLKDKNGVPVCTVQYNDRGKYSTDLDSGSWIKLKDIAPEPAPRNVAVAVPLTGNGPAGFYRVLTP